MVEEIEEQEEPQGEESNVPVLGSGREPRKVRPIKSTSSIQICPMWYTVFIMSVGAKVAMRR